MKELTDKQVNDIVKMGEEIQACIYAKSGEEDAFQVLDARLGKFKFDGNEELNYTIMSCIKENLPTMRGTTKEFFENEVLPSLFTYED